MIKINSLEGFENIKDMYVIYKRLNNVYFKNLNTGKPIKPFKKKGKANGYLYLKLMTKDNKSKNIRIHRIIAIAYIKTNDTSLEVDHIDENRNNCKINNLQWVSRKLNMSYRWNKQLRGIEAIEKNIIASMEVENLRPSKIGKSITRNFLEGKISSNEAITNIIKYHLSKGGVYNV